MRARTMLAAAAAMLCGTIGATTATSAATGLEVHPPAGYVAKPIAKDGTYATEYEVTSSADPDSGCQVGFQPTKRSGPTTQADINTAASTPAFLDTVRKSLSFAYDEISLQSFSTDGVDGVEAVGDIKASQGEARSLLVILETPAGRTNVSCVGDPKRFDQLRSSFEAIAHGVTPAR